MSALWRILWTASVWLSGPSRLTLWVERQRYPLLIARFGVPGTMRASARLGSLWRWARRDSRVGRGER